jgi:membrane protein DedA with SNARE-associated domain
MDRASLMWLPLGFHDWMPATQALTLALMTFVQEDVPTVGSALLAAAGGMTWKAGFIGCFLGIWAGDALLYCLARGVGRPLLEQAWARRFFDPVAVARSERWFADKGGWLLVSSRFIPGTRLPTYLAAGFLRLPFGRFLLITGLVVAFWTVAIFGLADVFGAGLVTWLRRLSHGGWALLVGVVIVVVLVRLLTRVFRREFWQRLHGRVGRWTRWEFWPPWLFYAPVALNYLRLAVRYRGFMVPTASNPGIFSGGFVGESKIETLAELSASCQAFTADAYLLKGVAPADRFAALERLRRRHGIEFPFVLKPDVGSRGVGVKVIRTVEQARAYLEQTSAALVMQRYAPGPNEAGVFYYRHPGEGRGRIFAITEKLFPTVTGDGTHTVEELIWRDPRARFMAQKYLKRLGARSPDVPADGETIRLVESGNHAQGCIFRDGMRLWTQELEDRIDAISQKVHGFFIGRYDVRYASEQDLQTGRAFQIIELNGASSEATNIYDSRNTLWSAYRTLFRQWDLVFAIGDANRRLGAHPTRLVPLWRKWRENCAQAATLPVAD